jgi:hypothetical protein
VFRRMIYGRRSGRRIFPCASVGLQKSPRKRRHDLLGPQLIYPTSMMELMSMAPDMSVSGRSTRATASCHAIPGSTTLTSLKPPHLEVMISVLLSFKTMLHYYRHHRRPLHTNRRHLTCSLLPPSHRASPDCRYQYPRPTNPPYQYLNEQRLFHHPHPCSSWEAQLEPQNQVD